MLPPLAAVQRKPQDSTCECVATLGPIQVGPVAQAAPAVCGRGGLRLYAPEAVVRLFLCRLANQCVCSVR